LFGRKVLNKSYIVLRVPSSRRLTSSPHLYLRSNYVNSKTIRVHIVINSLLLTLTLCLQVQRGGAWKKRKEQVE
jgi:hypothetical protein